MSDKLLDAIWNGLGHGETAIFPISIFQIKTGINYNPEDPNYDLFKKSIKVSAKRLFPNFVNEDAPYNAQYYKKDNYNSLVAVMGCADGDELVAYSYAGKCYCEGLKRLWDRIKNDHEVLTRGISSYMKPNGLKIWDGDNGYVDVKTVVKNPDQGNWVRITFDNGRSILVTKDHPLYLENKGRTRVEDLEIGDTIKTYWNLPTEETSHSFSCDGAYISGMVSCGSHIPEQIFNSSQESKAAFIAGVLNEIGVIRTNVISMYLFNKEAILQLAALLQSIGVPAKIYFANNIVPYKILYRLDFYMTNEIAKHLSKDKLLEYGKSCEYSKEVAIENPSIIKVTKIENLGSMNKESYDVETVTDHFTLSFINSGNCRTRTMGNINGPEESGSRGNFAFNTINLPYCALQAREEYPTDKEARIKRFYEIFDNAIDLSKEYLEFRYNIIAHKKVKNFPFLMQQGIWMDSEKFKPEDEIAPLLKHASLSIGFCGLAEALVALIGSHHGETEEARKLGLEIIQHLRNTTDRFTTETHMNWSTFSTPAESTAGSFLKKCKKRFGIIPGVTDREYLSNSFHCPVYYPIKAMDKIKIEGPYHALCNAGSISYIEMDGDPSKNLKAFEAIVKAMHDADMSYCSVNHAVDRDPVCGYTGIIENECPHCHRKESKHTIHLDHRLK